MNFFLQKHLGNSRHAQGVQQTHETKLSCVTLGGQPSSCLWTGVTIPVLSPLFTELSLNLL